ncbi:serine/threonine-protein kinase [Streptomyces sp. NPDC006514]|uniref:serine/threonine-protein kinase n=1 Tax=Streptomyces sp. NPDC006514 TaxID=3154308 RepID=UPI0033B4DE4C
MESLRPGDPLEIGGYRLLARLGSGGMGEVFLARTVSGRALALKTVHRELSLEADFAHRFDREIRTSDRVRSPWTVSVVDFSAPGASPQWLATEYVPAPSLGDWVRGWGPLQAPAVQQLGQELSAALVSVRAAGVVHRDIKPANVLLGTERPFLIDFGIARTVRDPRHTRTGTVIGTPGFLAPEQATGAVAGAAADVFSLAAVLVYAATGRSPFLADGEELDLPALLYRIVHDEPHLDGVPQPLRELVRECLAKDPQQRPLAEDIAARLAGGSPVQGWEPAAPQALAAEAGRRETELRHLLTLPHRQPAPPTPLVRTTLSELPARTALPPHPCPYRSRLLRRRRTPPHPRCAGRGGRSCVRGAPVRPRVPPSSPQPSRSRCGSPDTATTATAAGAGPPPPGRPPPGLPHPHRQRVRRGRCRPRGPVRGRVPDPELPTRTACPGRARVSSPSPSH